jgi:hypothetical protein
MILATMQKNSENVKKLLVKTISKISAVHCQCG